MAWTKVSWDFCSNLLVICWFENVTCHEENSEIKRNMKYFNDCSDFCRSFNELGKNTML